MIDTHIRNYLIHGLAEGLSIRSLERIFGTNKETILQYQFLARNACALFMNAVRRNRDVRRIEVDEFWSYVFKKQARSRIDRFILRGEIAPKLDDLSGGGECTHRPQSKGSSVATSGNHEVDPGAPNKRSTLVYLAAVDKWPAQNSCQSSD